MERKIQHGISIDGFEIPSASDSNYPAFPEAVIGRYECLNNTPITKLPKRDFNSTISEYSADKRFLERPANIDFNPNVFPSPVELGIVGVTQACRD